MEFNLPETSVKFEWLQQVLVQDNILQVLVVPISPVEPRQLVLLQVLVVTTSLNPCVLVAHMVKKTEPFVLINKEMLQIRCLISQRASEMTSDFHPNFSPVFALVYKIG